MCANTKLKRHEYTLKVFVRGKAPHKYCQVLLMTLQIRCTYEAFFRFTKFALLISSLEMKMCEKKLWVFIGALQNFWTDEISVTWVEFECKYGSKSTTQIMKIIWKFVKSLFCALKLQSTNRKTHFVIGIWFVILGHLAQVTDATEFFKLLHMNIRI